MVRGEMQHARKRAAGARMAHAAAATHQAQARFLRTQGRLALIDNEALGVL
jgi:hypothetical protein